jgi:hypothetical protein
VSVASKHPAGYLSSSAPPVAANDSQQHGQRLIIRWVAWGWFGLYLAVGLYLTLHLHYYAGDAVSRVSNAYDVLFGRNPHLGAIGFIWNPLPSVFELPLVALSPWIPAMVTKGLAGVVVSAALAAWAVFHLFRIVQGLGVRTGWAYVITLIFALNPLVVLYAANGMSDIMLVACILGTYHGVLDYLQTHRLRRLINGATWMALGLGMRYEAVPFAALVLVAFFVGQRSTAASDQRTATTILLGAPIVFAGGIWLYFNWLIMKNPLYFLNSNYGNLAQTRVNSYVFGPLKTAYHSVLGTFSYVGHFSLLCWPLGVAWVLTAAYVLWRRHDARAGVLLAGTLGAILLEIVFAFLGHLGPWDRYFISFIPDGVLLVVYLGTQALARVQRRWVHHLGWAAIAVILASANVGTYWTLQQPSYGHPDGKAIKLALQNRPLTYVSDPFRAVAPVVSYLDAHPQLTVLTDSFNAWPIVIRTTHFNRFIITSDYDFNSILFNPRGRVAALLLPQPTGDGALNAINRAWPGLWAGHLPWVKLIKAFPGGANWRLYAVLPNAP